MADVDVAGRGSVDMTDVRQIDRPSYEQDGVQSTFQGAIASRIIIRFEDVVSISFTLAMGKQIFKYSEEYVVLCKVDAQTASATIILVPLSGPESISRRKKKDSRGSFEI